jgi:hypothetical protein
MRWIADVTFSLVCNYQAPSYATSFVIQEQPVSIEGFEVEENHFKLEEHHHQLRVSSRCLHILKGTRCAPQLSSYALY